MKIFRNYTYSWFNIGIFKLALISVGILVGTHWHEFFLQHVSLMAALAAILSIYIISISYKK